MNVKINSRLIDIYVLKRRQWDIECNITSLENNKPTRKEYSRTDLANDLGITRSMLNIIINTATCTPERLPSIAKKIGVPEARLVISEN